MTVATVGCDLRPSTRVVLIKGYDERGIVWYTNYESRKGRQLAGNPLRRCSSTGWSSSAWCASRHRRKVSDARATSALPAARSTRASAPGPARKTRSSRPGAYRGRQCRQFGAIHAHAPSPTPLGWLPPPTRAMGVLAGRKAACTTGCATGAMEPNGYANAWHRKQAIGLVNQVKGAFCVPTLRRILGTHDKGDNAMQSEKTPHKLPQTASRAKKPLHHRCLARYWPGDCQSALRDGAHIVIVAKPPRPTPNCPAPSTAQPLKSRPQAGAPTAGRGHPRRGRRTGGRGQSGGRNLWRIRHPGQQRQRHQPDRHRSHAHEAL